MIVGGLPLHGQLWIEIFEQSYLNQERRYQTQTHSYGNNLSEGTPI